MGAHLNLLVEAILMSTHNIGFYGELANIIFQLSSNTHLIYSSGILFLRSIISNFCHRIFEPRREKTGFFAYVKTKTQISISAFVFATRIVQSLFFLNRKFQASSHLLWLYSQVCVGPGQTPPENRFSHNEAHLFALMLLCATQCKVWKLFCSFCLIS